MAVLSILIHHQAIQWALGPTHLLLEFTYHFNQVLTEQIEAGGSGRQGEGVYTLKTAAAVVLFILALAFTSTASFLHWQVSQWQPLRLSVLQRCSYALPELGQKCHSLQ